MHPQITVSFLTIIIFASAIGQIATDLYLPSIPSMSEVFHASPHTMQLTITIYMIGFCTTQLFYGPWSDAVGRRKPIITGLILLVIGSVVCCFATQIWMLFLGRLLQGFGSASGAALCRATLRDLLDKEQLAKVNSYLAFSMIGLLTLAPIVGGYIQQHAGWQYNFALVTCASLALLTAYMIHIPETAAHLHPENFTFRVISRNAKMLLTSREFMRYAICTFCTYGGVLVWLTATPVLLQNVVGLTPVQFGWTYLASGSGFLLGIISNMLLIIRVGIERMVTIGISLQVTAGILMLLGYCAGYLDTLSVMLPIGVYMIGTSLIFPNASSGSLSPFPKIAGLAGAIFGFMQISGGMISSAMVACMPDQNQLPIAAGFLLFSAISGIALKGLRA